jgi:hypothetical protein
VVSDYQSLKNRGRGPGRAVEVGMGRGEVGMGREIRIDDKGVA